MKYIKIYSGSLEFESVGLSKFMKGKIDRYVFLNTKATDTIYIYFY